MASISDVLKSTGSTILKGGQNTIRAIANQLGAPNYQSSPGTPKPEFDIPDNVNNETSKPQGAPTLNSNEPDSVKPPILNRQDFTPTKIRGENIVKELDNLHSDIINYLNVINKNSLQIYDYVSNKLKSQDATFLKIDQKTSVLEKEYKSVDQRLEVMQRDLDNLKFKKKNDNLIPANQKDPEEKGSGKGGDIITPAAAALEAAEVGAVGAGVGVGVGGLSAMLIGSILPALALGAAGGGLYASIKDPGAMLGLNGWSGNNWIGQKAANTGMISDIKQLWNMATGQKDQSSNTAAPSPDQGFGYGPPDAGKDQSLSPTDLILGMKSITGPGAGGDSSDGDGGDSTQSPSMWQRAKNYFTSGSRAGQQPPGRRSEGVIPKGHPAAVDPREKYLPLSEREKLAAEDLQKMTGQGPNSDILQKYLRDGGVGLNPQQQAWCAATVDAAYQRHGIRGSGSYMASSFANYGEPVKSGDIKKGDSVYTDQYHMGSGHVGLATGNVNKQGQIETIAGNTGHKVNTFWADPRQSIVRRPGEAQDMFADTDKGQQPQQQAVAVSQSNKPSASNVESPYLAQRRSAIFAKINSDPKLKEQVAATLAHEGSTKEQAQATLESLVDRMAYKNETDVMKELNSGFYGPRNRGEVGAPNSGEMKAYDWAANKVAGGSNVIGLRTDQGTWNKEVYQGVKGGINVAGEGYADWGNADMSRLWREQQTAAMQKYDSEHKNSSVATNQQSRTISDILGSVTPQQDITQQLPKPTPTSGKPEAMAVPALAAIKAAKSPVWNPENWTGNPETSPFGTAGEKPILQQKKPIETPLYSMDNSAKASGNITAASSGFKDVKPADQSVFSKAPSTGMSVDQKPTTTPYKYPSNPLMPNKGPAITSPFHDPEGWHGGPGSRGYGPIRDPDSVGLCSL